MVNTKIVVALVGYALVEVSIGVDVFRDTIVSWKNPVTPEYHGIGTCAEWR